MIGPAMPIYLDCAATTPLDPRVRAEMLQYLDEDFGNAGSRTHA
jgi:cysteine desulfurase